MGISIRNTNKKIQENINNSDEREGKWRTAITSICDELTRIRSVLFGSAHVSIALYGVIPLCGKIIYLL